MSADPKEPVFFLTGGPGQSNMEFEFANRYADDRDFVLVGYRGVDGSVRLDCPEVESALKRSTDVLSEEFFRAYGDGYRTCADRLSDEGVDLASYGLAQQVDDLESARVAFGYDRINLLSESAGTRTAMIYGWRYPESIHRSVMVAVNPPGAFLLDADTTDEQIGRYAALCADDDSCRTRTDDLAATMRRTAADIPDRWLFLPIKDGNVQVVSMFGLIDSTPAASPTPAPMTLDAWLSAAEGDPSGFWLTSVLGDLLFPELFVRGQYAAAAMLDAQAARDYFTGGQGDLSNLASAVRRSAVVVAGWPTRGRPRPTRAATAGCGPRRWRRSSLAASSTPRRRRRPPELAHGRWQDARPGGSCCRSGLKSGLPGGMTFDRRPAGGWRSRCQPRSCRFGSMPQDCIGNQAVRRWVGEMLTAGLSATTVRKAVSALRQRPRPRPRTTGPRGTPQPTSPCRPRSCGTWR